ncbi:hypothetical protein [Novosphingobium malaysiense]|uniref:Aminoglycoside phosphotransferase domain-containing protein n=1 Tax=Novosphingobium malaysiense TaxID=1348853 RepID=A0A0B1ZIF3_9SPHN|nr:hypothetical protein [Novosphingobium malaysiense]KHK89058.1 hypothetical protein LK12_22135 [Novosphingobium malaysiense]
MTSTQTIDWAQGDMFGIAFPAHPEALKAGGPEFLTRAFRMSGALGLDNSVMQITRLDEWMLGGTGVKALLSVTYERETPDLPRDLFVKFSRNFQDQVRDSGRYHMPPEVRLANLSREPGFPVAVPKCLFADIAQDTLTGIIVTERIPYGEGAVEPHYPKCMDHLLPEPFAHYSVLIANLARLSGAYKAGHLGESVERYFPLDLGRLVTGRPRFEKVLLAKRINRLAEFILQYPHLAPAHIADRAFLEDFCADALSAVDLQEDIWRFLYSQPDLIALCHMNANIDNAWFWHESDGTLRAGLIDWGSVGQMSVASSIWGCIGAAEPEMHDRHLDELLELFVREYAHAGGPVLDRDELAQHLEMLAMMSALHMTTAPPAILREIPDPGAASDRFDPLFTEHETARVQLKVTIALLNMWERRKLGRHLRPDAPWRC